MASERQDYRTPKKVFLKIQEDLGVKFKIDAAATKQNALCRRFFSPTRDGLSQAWDADTFCNPEYKHFKLWILKAMIESVQHPNKVYAVIGPVGCSQTWFHMAARRTWKILVPNQRIKYDNPDGTPTKGGDSDTMIYVFCYAKVPRTRLASDPVGHDIFEGWRLEPFETP